MALVPYDLYCKSQGKKPDPAERMSWDKGMPLSMAKSLFGKKQKDESNEDTDTGKESGTPDSEKETGV
jgi:hypothetical protein